METAPPLARASEASLYHRIRFARTAEFRRDPNLVAAAQATRQKDAPFAQIQRDAAPTGFIGTLKGCQVRWRMRS